MTQPVSNTSFRTLFAHLKNRVKRPSAASKSGYGPDKNSLRYKVTHWLLTSPRLTLRLALIAVLITVAITFVHIHLHGDSLFTSKETESELVFLYLRGFYFLGLGLLFPILVLCFFRHRVNNLIFPVTIASAAVLSIWALSEYILWQPSSHLYHSGIAPSIVPEIFRLLLVSILILSPPFLVLLFRRSSILDRYLLRQFLGPFILCSVAILAIWIIYDLQDNGFDFFEARVSFGTILQLYIIQLPQMIVMILPATLLLGLLYSLGKMSKSNELVSMLSSGRSLVRVISPLLFVGFYSSILCFALNYEWAPQATARKDSILSDIGEQRRANKGKAKKTRTVLDTADIALARNQSYEASDALRYWRIRYIPLDLTQRKISGIEIYERADGKLSKVIFAEKAGWNHETSEWFFRSSTQNQVKIFDYSKLDPEGNPTFTEMDEHIETGWNETPWNIVSEHLVPDHLGIPALGFHLQANSDKANAKLSPFRAHWHNRWALPWNCLVVVLFAAPLGIGLSRRGVIGGVIGAVTLLVALISFGHLFLVLAQSNIVSPLIGAWAPNIVLSLIGIYLIYLRSNNRDLPKLNPLALLSILKLPKVHPSDPLPATAGFSIPPTDQHHPNSTTSEVQARTHRRRSTVQSSSRKRASDFDLDFD